MPNHHGRGSGPDSSHWGCFTVLWILITVAVVLGIAYISTRPR